MSISLQWDNDAQLANLTPQRYQDNTGEDETLAFTQVTGSTDVTGWTLQFTLALYPGEAAILTLPDSRFSGKTSGGAFNVAIHAADTLTFPSRAYYFEVRRVDSGHNTLMSKGYCTLNSSNNGTTVVISTGAAQPLNANLTEISALTVDAFGLGVITKTTAAAVRTYIGAGTSSFSGAYGDLTGTPSLSGYVSGPASSADNAIARFDSTTGKILKVSAATISDDGSLVIGGVGAFTVDGPSGSVGCGDVDATSLSSSAEQLFLGAHTITAAGNATISGTNTGDQDLSGYVPTSRTVNGAALSGNVTITVTGTANQITVSGGTGTTPTVSLPSSLTFPGHTNYGTQTANTSSSNAVTIDWTAKNYQKLTLSENVTITFTAPSGHASLTLELNQGGSSYTITWPTITWLNADGATTTPPSTLTSGQKMLVTLQYNGSKYRAQYSPAFTDT